MADKPRTRTRPTIPSPSLKLKEGSAAALPQPPSRRKEIDRRERGEDVQPEQERRQGDDRRQRAMAADRSRQTANVAAEQQEIRLAQHRRKRILAACEPVMSLNYDLLAMDDYPENSLVALARRDRDYWAFLCACCTVVFLLGLFGLANAWLAGSAFGLMFLSWVFAFSPLRSQFFARPPLRRLLQARREIEFRALNHIRLLESNGGLIWRCRELASHNPNLNRKLFRGILNFSANGTLLQVLRSRQHIRLYLLFLLEAQKAYQRLHQEYLEHHFRHLEQGWDDRLSATEAQDLQQSDPGRTE